MGMSFGKRRQAFNGIVLLGLLLLWISCNENTIDPTVYGSVDGSVFYAADSLPVYGAEVSTTPASVIAYTDSAGTFFLSGVPAGEVTVSVRAEGLKTGSRKVIVRRNQNTTVGFRLESGDAAPMPPTSPSPEDGQTIAGTAVTLRWSAGGNQRTDLTYDIIVYEGTSSAPVLQVTDLEDTSVAVEALTYNTHYFWQVVAKNSQGTATQGPLWTFTTGPFPDNRYLFISGVHDNFEVFSSNEEATTTARLTYTPSHELNPLYSHNRARIAFVRRTANGDHIFIADQDGSDAQQITTLPVAGYHSTGRGFTWSPDDGRILYSHYDKLYSVAKDGGELTEIAEAPAGRHFGQPDWAVDGKRIIVTTVGSVPYDSDIRLINLVTQKDSVVVDDLPGVLQSPAFSVDGNSILYTHDVSGFESLTGKQLDARIFLYNLQTRAKTDLSNEKTPGTNDLNPRFSPDGSQVIFENISNDNSGPSAVWLVNIADLKRKRLFDNARMPDWK
jgi:TolB protein